MRDLEKMLPESLAAFFSEGELISSSQIDHNVIK